MTDNIEISGIITAALIAIMSTTIIAENVEARFCVTPTSPIGQVADKLIKLQQGMLLLKPNNQTINQGIANLTSTLCKPGETMSLFGNQSGTFKTNLTTTNLTTPNPSGNSSVSKVQNNTGPLTNINRILNIPVQTNQFTQGWSVNNVTLYLNSTDGHYHLKGHLKNTLPETRSGFEYIQANFEDKTTNSTVDSESGSMNIVMNPNTTVPFDIKTLYTADKANQFQFMNVQITP